jgi:hypothetical protein
MEDNSGHVNVTPQAAVKALDGKDILKASGGVPGSPEAVAQSCEIAGQL